MRETLKAIIDLSGFWFWIPSLVGGFVDYLNQIQRGTKRWSFIGFVTHLLSALFFGWFCGAIAIGMEYDVNIVAACGGMGGFFGVRAADLVAYRFMKTDRRDTH